MRANISCQEGFDHTAECLYNVSMKSSRIAQMRTAQYVQVVQSAGRSSITMQHISTLNIYTRVITYCPPPAEAAHVGGGGPFDTFVP